MTWGKFKALMDAVGVRDEHQIGIIVIDGQDTTISVAGLVDDYGNEIEDPVIDAESIDYGRP